MSDKTEIADVPNGTSERADHSPILAEKAEEGTKIAAPTQSSNHNRIDGGLMAWIQVAAGWSIFFNTWGILNTFGVFQTYYESGALFTETSSNIAWIGSIQALTLVTVGLFSGPLYDRGYFTALMLVGSFMMAFSFMMLSICRTFWEALLAQGFCFGIGAGLVFVPTLAVLPTYFSKKLGLAVGIAASGSSLGGVIYPIVFYNLINSVGFGWAVRAIGFIMLGTLLVPVCLMRVRIKPARPRAFLDWSAFTDGPFAFFAFSTTIGFLGLYVVMFFVSYFAEAKGVASDKMAFYLIPVLNASSVFGRTIPNYISDKTGPLNLFGLAAVICGVLTFCLISVTNLGGVVAIVALYGFFSGVYVALPSVCFVRLTADKTKIGTRIGMGYAFTSIAVLAGGPGGGGVLGTGVVDLHWNSLWIYGGITTLTSGVMLIALRFWMTKGKILMKI
ncbi:hypothetical protein BP6252_13944 [Coleophoma cylindrospora]|uniref:Major facilitator superfamily (MFS) profile domain-containing protein n=1 Tax=Coleophoma cylindrospora TaxID=1849047 RepID=A0A3D8Q596_9HELO|nr:hypothetical protein BP6252_13944 [Coleophoma cylindrospora]